jgi:hypothetical protein
MCIFSWLYAWEKISHRNARARWRGSENILKRLTDLKGKKVTGLYLKLLIKTSIIYL